MLRIHDIVDKTYNFTKSFAANNENSDFDVVIYQSIGNVVFSLMINVQKYKYVV